MIQNLNQATSYPISCLAFPGIAGLELRGLPDIAGSDPDKRLFLWKNRCNLGCFFLLEPAFWGQKVYFKDFGVVIRGQTTIKIILHVERVPNSFLIQTGPRLIGKMATT